VIKNLFLPIRTSTISRNATLERAIADAKKYIGWKWTALFMVLKADTYKGLEV